MKNQLLKFCFLLILLLFVSSDCFSKTKPYKGKAKQERKFRDNNLEMMSEQSRIFNLHPQKHYNKRALNAKLRRSAWIR